MGRTLPLSVSHQGTDTFVKPVALVVATLAATILSGWWLVPQYGVATLSWLVIAAIVLVIVVSPILIQAWGYKKR